MTHQDMTGLSVLLVEDEYLMASDLAAAFEVRGARVIGPAASVIQAIALIDEGPRPDVAVLDVNLAGERVFAVADRLMQDGVPFVLTTGYDAAALPSRFENRPRLEKPISPTVVMAAVSNLIERRGSARPL